MRVLLVSHVAPPHIGGVESVVWMEARAFLDAGHEVVWLTSDATGDGASPEAAEGFRLVRVRACHWMDRLFGIAYPLFAPTLPFRLWREVGKADLVHVHGLVFPGSPIAALFARLRKKRCVCTDHGGLLTYRWWVGTAAVRLLMETVGRVTARCAHKLIAINRDVEALLVRLGGGADKVQFLPNPVDSTVFRPPTAEQRSAARAALGWTDDRPRVLCVSRLLPHKGIHILTAARDEGAGFDVVFCGPGEDSTREELRAGGAEVLEPRPWEGVLQLYHAADAFCLPSHNEGFPVVIQEALACGLPVVTSDLEAYAPYRDLPGLHLCEPVPDVVRETLQAVLAVDTPDASPPLEDGDGDSVQQAWLEDLCAPTPVAGGAA